MIPIFLKGLDLVEDKDSISEYKKDTDVVFVLDSMKPLFEYIDELKLKDSISYKLKICKELKDLDADYEVNGENRHFTTFSQLIEMIDLSADFTELLTQSVSQSCQSEYQGKRFRTLLHHSTFQIISSPNSEPCVHSLVPNLFN